MNVTALVEMFKAYTALSRLFPRRKPFPVLIVDDDLLYTEQLESICKELKLPSETVYSIDGARTAIRHGQYGLVLLDIGFGPDDMAGINFHNEMKSQRPNLKIVILSGFTERIHRSTVGHVTLFINKNVGYDGVKASISEAWVLNGGFHASNADMAAVALLLIGTVGFIGHNDRAIWKWIKTVCTP